MIEIKFKQTEAGLIPEDWNTYTINDLFDIGNGYTPSKSNPLYWTNGSIPWFRMEDIRKNGRILADSIQHITPIAVKNGKLFPAGSFILSTTATIGEYALLIADSLANQQFSFLTKKLNRNHIVDTNYFFHYLYKIGDWCRKNINEGGLMAVNMEDLKKHECAIPSLAEQRRIASALTSIDNLIDSLDKLISKTRAIKQGMMQRLLKPLYNIPLIFKPLGEVCDIKGRIGFRGYTRRDIVSKGNGAISLSPSNIIDNNLSFEDCTYISWFKYNESPEIMAEVNDIVFTKTASVGKTALITTLPNETTINPQIVLLKNISCNPIYLSYILQDDRFQAKVQEKNGVGCVPNISQSILESLIVVIPSLKEQEFIAHTLTSIDNKIASLEAKRKKYVMIKQGMMQQLLTGKIRLKA